MRRIKIGGQRENSGGSLRWQLLEKDRRIAELQAVIARAENLDRENLELRTMVNLPVPFGWQAVAAEVVLRDPVFWNQKFTINKGLSDQVQVGALVMLQGQVLGRVVRNERHLSEVAMLGSPDCRLGVRIGDSSYVGVCRGLSRERESGRLEVDYLPRDLKVPPGTVLYTSGLGGILPAGLPVGRAVMGKNGAVVQKLDQSRGVLQAEMLQKTDRFQFVMVLVPKRKS